MSISARRGYRSHRACYQAGTLPPGGLMPIELTMVPTQDGTFNLIGRDTMTGGTKIGRPLDPATACNLHQITSLNEHIRGQASGQSIEVNPGAWDQLTEIFGERLVTGMFGGMRIHHSKSGWRTVVVPAKAAPIPAARPEIASSRKSAHSSSSGRARRQGS